MQGLAILLGFHFLGMLCQTLFNIPLPPNVIGLILFVICLFTGWIRLEWVEQSAQFLLKHMMLFFAPYIVGTITFWPLIQQHGLSILLSLVTSSLIALIVTGWVSQWMERGRRSDQYIDGDPTNKANKDSTYQSEDMA